jgi:Flp pilus assembly protein TadG
MLSCAGARRIIPALVAGTAAFRHDRKGIAAIEFALIAPLLLAMYFVTMEVSQAIETSKKVGRAGNMVADLVAQQKQVDTSTLDDIMKIASATLMPYNRSVPTVAITAIDISDTQATVAWSRKLVNGATGVGTAKKTAVTVPASYNVPGNFLIRVDVQLGYRPVITWTAGGKQTLGLAAAFDSINMSETYYYYPRFVQQKIPCSNC